MRISDWSSDVCSSDLISDQPRSAGRLLRRQPEQGGGRPQGARGEQIGRASCRERVCQYVEISVVAVSLKKKSRQYIPDIGKPYTKTILQYVHIVYRLDKFVLCHDNLTSKEI